MKKELIVLFVIFIILSVGMHYEKWLLHPILHLQQLPSSGAYGLGFIHPLVFTLIIYGLFWIPRGVLKLIKGIKKGS